MHLSIKYEWFRDWFRTGFVWFRVFLYLLSWTDKNHHGEIPRCRLLHGLRIAILHVFVSKLFTNSIWGAMKLNPF